MPYRRSSRSLLRGRARLLEAVTAQGVDVGHAHIAALVRAGSTVPFIRCLRSVPLAPITGVFVRIDIGLCAGSLHSRDQSQSTKASNQSALHHSTSLWTRTCHNFYWYTS